MPTTVVKTIGLGTGNGYDFSGASAITNWIASLSGLNLVTADQIQQGQLFFNGTGDGEFTAAGVVADFSAQVVTTDATRYVELTTGAGQSFRDNAGVRTNPLYYDATKGVGLRNTGASGYTIAQGNFVSRFTNLQVKGDASSTGTFGSSTAACVVNNCLFQGTEVAINSTVLSTINNSVMITTLPQSGRAYAIVGATVNHNFCTFIVPSGVSVANMVDYFSLTSVVNFNSCALFGVTGSLGTALGSSTITYVTCASDLGSPPSGVTGSLTYANQFVSNVNDFRQKAGAALQGAGTADATNGAFDISNLARPQSGNWDIGAWEFAAAGGGSAPTYLFFGQATMMMGEALVWGAGAKFAHDLIRNPIRSRRRLLTWRDDK